MAVPFRLRQQQQLQQKLDTSFKDPRPKDSPVVRTVTVESANSGVASRPSSPQSSFSRESNFFDYVFRDQDADNESDLRANDDKEDDPESDRVSVVSSNSSNHSLTTQALAARLDKLLPSKHQSESPVSVPETTYGAVSKEEAARVRGLDPLDYSAIANAKKKVVVKNIQGEMRGSVSIVPIDNNLDEEVRLVKNSPPRIVQQNPNVQTFTYSKTPELTSEKLPPRPEKSPRRSPEFAHTSIPIPPRSVPPPSGPRVKAERPAYHARALSEDERNAYQLPHPPPRRGSSFDRSTPPKYVNRPVPPLNQQFQYQQQSQQSQQQQQYIPPKLHARPPLSNFNNQNPSQNNVAPLRRDPGPSAAFPHPSRPVHQQTLPDHPSSKPTIEQFRMEDNSIHFRPPVMPFQQVAPIPVPTSFRSRGDQPRTPRPFFVNHPAGSFSPPPLNSEHPPQRQHQPPLHGAEKLQGGTGANVRPSPKIVSASNSMTSLDIVPPSWPRGIDSTPGGGGGTLVRKLSEDSSLPDIREEEGDEDETLKHTSGDEDHRSNGHHRRNQSRDDDEDYIETPRSVDSMTGAGVKPSEEKDERERRRNNKKRHHRRHRGRARSGSRDGSASASDGVDSETGEKRRRRKRRGGVVISRRARRIWKVVITLVVANLVVVDVLVVLLLVVL